MIGDIAAVVTATFFYDYWTVTDGKWKRLTPEESKTAENQIYNIKYDVYYRAPVKAAQPVADIPFQLVPQADPANPKVTKATVASCLSFQAKGK